MRWTCLYILATLALTAPASDLARAQGVDRAHREPDAGVETQGPVAAAALEVRYLANEGFLVEGGGKRVLIDGLFGDGVSGYPVAPAELMEEVELGAGEWGGVRVALASHYHPDHFSPDSVARFLAANPQAVFVSTPQARALFARGRAEQADLLARFRAFLPAAGAVERLVIDGVEIAVLNLHHGEGSPPTENLGFVVSLGDQRFLHFGDTEAKMEDFEPYLELLEGIDLGLLPFWFLSSEWRAEMVRDRIRPRRIVVGHMPLATSPTGYFGRWQSYGNLVRTIRTAFPDARFPGDPGEPLRFEK